MRAELTNQNHCAVPLKAAPLPTCAGTIYTTVRPLLSAVLGRTKFWSRKPRINEVRG